MWQKLLKLSDKGRKDLNKAIIACVLSNLTLLIPFMILTQVMRTLIAPLQTGEPFDSGMMWILFGAGIAAAALYFIAYRNEYDKTYTVAYKESEHARVEVAERLRKLPLSFFNQKDLSELTTNIMGDCANIEHTMSHLVPSMVANMVTITLTCAMLCFYDWRMSLAMFCTMPISFGIISASKKLQSKYGARHVQAKLDVADQVQEYLEGIKVVKAFAVTGEKFRALDGALQRMMKEAIRFEALAGSFVVTAQMILRVGSGLVILAGVILLSGGEIDLVKFLTFLMISLKIYAPVTTLMTLFPEFFYMLTATKRVQRLREEPVMSGKDDIRFDDFNIELKNVSFAYNEEFVIKNLSTTIPQNAVTALVGPSGSGKSTVSRLIARFWDVGEGQILIGGKNIKDIDPEYLMKYMSFVFQDVVLFDDTVYNNIRIGRPEAGREEVINAAKLARCDSFINELPEGYDTVIGENGCTISGGERQRISIARALLKDAPIVLLDEATSSLDPENEALIQEAISELVGGRTVVVIAHRLRTIAGADKIIVLNEGRLVEEGEDKELMKNDGLYAKLFKIQKDSLGWTVRAN